VLVDDIKNFFGHFYSPVLKKWNRTLKRNSQSFRIQKSSCLAVVWPKSDFVFARSRYPDFQGDFNARFPSIQAPFFTIHIFPVPARHSPGYHSVIEEIVEGFVEDFSQVHSNEAPNYLRRRHSHNVAALKPASATADGSATGLTAMLTLGGNFISARGDPNRRTSCSPQLNEPLPPQTYSAGSSRKKLAGKLLVTVTATFVTPMTGRPLLTVSQLVEARFVTLCKM
jgi:hypothetical protein